MTTVQHVKIGSNFFAGAFRDYSDWHWAWVREILQNSQDSSGCNQIIVNFFVNEDNETIVRVANNGIAMTEEVLLNKFLALGESGKNFATGSVGGFGKAKELLVFCHKDWEIQTGNLVASGIGGEYHLTSQDHVMGTITTVTMTGDQTYYLDKHFAKYASLAQWQGSLTVNGTELATKLKRGTHRRDFSWGKVYTNKSNPNTLICRINGIPMFSRNIDFAGTVLIELEGSSNLTSNRDGMSWSARCELDNFVSLLSTNKAGAFQDPSKKSTKVRFPGYKLAGRFEEEIREVSINQAVNVTTLAAKETLEKAIEYLAADSVLTKEHVETFFRPEFYIKSELKGTIQAKFMPDTFSPNSKKLINVWISLLVELASLTKSNKRFAVGFNFSDDNLALYEYADGTDILYINPAKANKVRYSLNETDNYNLLSIAVHEFIHLEGYCSHNESFAGRFTELAALVMLNLSRFTRHFNQTLGAM